MCLGSVSDATGFRSTSWRPTNPSLRVASHPLDDPIIPISLRGIFFSRGVM
ncbi:unnamed protein product [Arabidopsis halleri]